MHPWIHWLNFFFLCNLSSSCWKHACCVRVCSALLSSARPPVSYRYGSSSYVTWYEQTWNVDTLSLLKWQRRCEITFTPLCLCLCLLPFARSGGERGGRREAGEAAAQLALLGLVGIRLFRVVGGATSSGGSRRDAAPGSHLLGSLPDRQRAGLRQSRAWPWAPGVRRRPDLCRWFIVVLWPSPYKRSSFFQNVSSFLLTLFRLSVEQLCLDHKLDWCDKIQEF